MRGEMKFEDSSLTGYLVKHLESLTEADPTILAEYVVALLKKDKPVKELQKLCTDDLVEFLGHGTKSFVTKLFQALDDGTITRPVENIDSMGKSDPSPSHASVDPVELKSSSPKEENHSTSSGPASDSEDKERSDDDDDDRNHKHRRRDSQPQSLDKDAQEQFLRLPNRKRDKPYENGQLFLASDSQLNEIQREYNPSLGKELSSKSDKRRPGLGPLLRAPVDLGLRTRIGQAFRTDPGSHFDLSTSFGRSSLVGRGRGRGTGLWNQQDSRFNPLDTFDFPSQMPSQGPTHPSLFVETGLPNAATAQSSSWGAFGFIPGMPNRCLDPLHPLSLQGTLHPQINPPLNLGMPRQRCRDFEERGFCLRGDMCPMEHGINRIVVEDVQSLSQFNLPVSLPSTRILGTQHVSGTLPPVPSSASLSTNSKALPSKSSKSGVNDDGLGLNEILSASAAAEADVYDPDQPLWNNDRPESSTAVLKLPSPRIYDAEPSDHHSFRLSDNVDHEYPTNSTTVNIGSEGMTSSVWGRIGAGNKLEGTRRIDNTVTTTSYLGNEAKDEQQEILTSTSGVPNHGKRVATTEAGPKTVKLARTDSGRKVGRASQKALRTLFVNGIPQKNNRRDALLSHFQKFGEVIDIYIPLNSEKAFVQFSKREEAEVALKAPDAVMGNRFIKLWWANRDSIPDDGESGVHTMSVAARLTLAPSVLSQPAAIDRERGNVISATPKVDAQAPATVPLKSAAVNIPKATPPPQKKLETLVLLKEELRRKQEMLAQKRNDFKRQLDKFEKQAVTVSKGEILSEQVLEKLKVDKGAELDKASTPKPANVNTGRACLEAEKALDKSISGESIISPSSKVNSTMPQQSPRSLKQATRTPAPLINRFKLDNRPTAFKILPPLPADLANVAALKDHFSSFGDLVGVELENTEVDPEGAGLKLSSSCSARVTFTTRRYAEKAFVAAKCWQGHNLQFTWLMATSSSNNGHGARENSSTPTNKGVPNTEIQSEPVISRPSSANTEIPISSAISEEAGAMGNREHMHVEGNNCGTECSPSDSIQVSHSDSPSMSSSEKFPPKSGVSMVGDVAQ